MTHMPASWPHWWQDRGHPLPLTGERTLPGIAHERYWFARHVVGYQIAADALAAAPTDAPAPVLDAGCGEGYGAALLASRRPLGAAVVGADMDSAAVAHAHRVYGEAARFCTAEITCAPFRDGAFGAVVASQVIEHLWDVDAWLDDVARLLTPDGTLVVLTPNRHTFTPGHDEPVSPFHVTEFAPDELRGRLTGRFRDVAVHGVVHGARLRALEDAHGVGLPQAQSSAPPERWPTWLRDAVATTRPGDFARAPAEASLDHVAVATRPAADAGPTRHPWEP